MGFITVKNNVYSILKWSSRLHVSTLWGSSSGLYNVLKLSIHKRYFANGMPLAKYRLCIDSFSALLRPDDEPYRVETCSLVDYFNMEYKLCFTVIKIRSSISFRDIYGHDFEQHALLSNFLFR
jgi:hypothetical protein